MVSCSIPQYEQLLTAVSICLHGGSTTPVESGPVGDQEARLVAVLLSMLPVINTVKCVGESLAIRLEVQIDGFGYLARSNGIESMELV